MMKTSTDPDQPIAGEVLYGEHSRRHDLGAARGIVETDRADGENRGYLVLSGDGQEVWVATTTARVGTWVPYQEIHRGTVIYDRAVAETIAIEQHGRAVPL